MLLLYTSVSSPRTVYPLSPPPQRSAALSARTSSLSLAPWTAPHPAGPGVLALLGTLVSWAGQLTLGHHWAGQEGRLAQEN